MLESETLNWIHHVMVLKLKHNAEQLIQIKCVKLGQAQILSIAFLDIIKLFLHKTI